MENIETINEKENPLFSRKEVIIKIKEKSVPSHADTEKIISEKFSTNPESIKVKKIDARFGSDEFIISAFIYSSPEEKNKIEPKPKQKAK